MLYIKYRPKTIAELDNSSVALNLKQVLESKVIPHAFLFVGQKGTGKTSAARIFAKAVNCLNNRFSKKGESVEPCNICSHCIGISNSSFTDVLEIDAASNRGIEEIKNLIKETSFLPMSGKYRVFIIDEAHMITQDGFNALLKTLEEPPKTSIFILATTNPEKLPKTIISRCFKINFGKAHKKDIHIMINRILAKEKVSFPKEVLELIAKHGESSFRDSTKILEEFIMQKIFTVEEAEKYLGVRGKNNILELIEKAEQKNTLIWINQFGLSGGNFKSLIEDLLEKLRMILLSKKGLQIEDVENSSLSVAETMLLIKLLMEAYKDLKISPIESLPLEIAIAEFYNQRVSRK